MNYWLMKSEPLVYPWKNLVEDKKTHWDGVRNYQARNMMRDDMKLGDRVLFYHSNFKPPHVVGVAEICKEGHPDHTAQDPSSNYYDEKATPENPRWMMVEIKPVIAMGRLISLQEMRDNPALEGMKLLMKGSRLSVQPVTEKHFEIVCQMGGLKGIPE
jgi:predicted RNA-binding protein with PUA-like domain|tara:strand:+ start:3643 stop:4116 length:474 start_codon:yes stop_codon:yes gene_type:complete